MLPPPARDVPQSKPIARSLRWFARRLGPLVQAGKHFDALVYAGVPARAGPYLSGLATCTMDLL